MSGWALPAWTPSSPDNPTLPPYTIESWPILSRRLDVEGPFDDVDDFRRRALHYRERSMRVYEMPDRRRLRIALPEEYGHALDATDRVLDFLSGNRVDAAPDGTIVDPSLLQRATPKDIVSLLELGPPPSFVDAVVLLDEPNPADEWYRQLSGNVYFGSAASASRGEITFYRAGRGPELREQLFHELAHLLGESNEVDMHWFAVAAQLEADGYMHRDRAALSLEENWAVHLGECVFGEDGEHFMRFCLMAPLRAAVLGRVLTRLFEPGVDRWTDAAAEQRAIHLGTTVRAAAIDLLHSNIAESRDYDPCDARLRLLLALADGAPLTGFDAWTRLDLSGSLLTSRALISLGGFVALEELNLSGMLIGRGGLDGLPALPRLRHLDLHGLSVWSSDMRRLQPLAALEWLDVSGTKINESGLLELCRLPALRFLRVTATDAASHATEFCAHRPELVIEV